MGNISFRAHKVVIRWKIYTLSSFSSRQDDSSFHWWHNRRFILVGPVTLIWWEITLIPGLAAIAMTVKAPLLRRVFLNLFSTPSCTLWEARYGLWFPQSFGVNVMHKLHSLPLTVAYKLFREKCRRNVDYFFFFLLWGTHSPGSRAANQTAESYVFG